MSHKLNGRQTVTKGTRNDRPTLPKTNRIRKEVQLIVPTGIPDQDALLSVVREWLSPLMVQQFIREREIDPLRNEVMSRKSSTAPFAKEHAAKNRVTEKI
jgi:hypothetical protein